MVRPRRAGAGCVHPHRPDSLPLASARRVHRRHRRLPRQHPVLRPADGRECVRLRRDVRARRSVASPPRTDRARGHHSRRRSVDRRRHRRGAGLRRALRCRHAGMGRLRRRLQLLAVRVHLVGRRRHRHRDAHPGAARPGPRDRFRRPEVGAPGVADRSPFPICRRTCDSLGRRGTGIRGFLRQPRSGRPGVRVGRPDQPAVRRWPVRPCLWSCSARSSP